MPRRLETEQAIPTINYDEGVNETTPYFIKVDPQGYADRLRQDFKFSQRQIAGVRVTLLKEGRSDRAAETEARPLGLGTSSDIRVFLGSYWKHPVFRTRNWLGRETRDWEGIRASIALGLAHESQHAADFRQTVRPEIGVVGPLVASGIFTISKNLVGEDSKLARVLDESVKLAFFLSIAQIFISVASQFVPSEEKAAAAAKRVDIEKWRSIIEFRKRV